MNNTRIEYSKRLHEVEVYFDTLKLLDNGSCSIKCVDILGVETIKTIDSELSTILKANGFLLLYNLVESTIRKSIDAIISSIHSSTVTFRDLSDELRKIWIRQEGKNANVDKIKSIASFVLEDNIDMHLVNAIGEQNPEIVIFKDSGFLDENIKVNAIQELKKHKIDESNIKTL